jgi:hypothetical protein
MWLMANVLGALLGGMMPQAVAPQERATISAPKEHMQTLRDLTNNMPIGTGWTVRVIPANQWRAPQAPPESNHPPHAYSDLRNRTTYLRGDVFHDLPERDIQRILAHELGHLTLNTSNEEAANKWSDMWMKQAKQ